MKASRLSVRSAERYREAEARLLRSLRRCQQETSPHDLQLRALERSIQTLSHLAEESRQDAKQLIAKTIDRATMADLDSKSHALILSQRWKAERRQDLISQHIEVLQNAITSLKSSPTPLKAPSSAEIALTRGGHEGNQVAGPGDNTYANLVSFLDYPQRVVPLHYRSHSRPPKTTLRPLHLSSPIVLSTTITTSLTTAAPSDSSSDSSLDMHLQTPVVTDSLAQQQARSKLLINETQAGTAIIHSQPLPPAIPLDPSNVEVELPDYVHELLADFDAQGNTAPSPSTLVEFRHKELAKDSRRRSFWPFKARHKDRRASLQPELRSKSSLKRLSGLMSASEMLTLRKKVNLKEGSGSKTTLMSVSGTESGEDVEKPPHSRVSSSSRTAGKATSRFSRRIPVVTSIR